MSFEVIYSKRAKKELHKLDPYTRRMIKAWIDNHLVGTDDPRATGKALGGDRTGQWRYRIGDYRLITIIEDEKMIILALNIGHRREIYHS